MKKELTEKGHGKKHEMKETKKNEKIEHTTVKKTAKIAKVMGEFKKGSLHSGSNKGPVVNNPKQAIAIAISESKKKK